MDLGIIQLGRGGYICLFIELLQSIKIMFVKQNVRIVTHFIIYTYIMKKRKVNYIVGVSSILEAF